MTNRYSVCRLGAVASVQGGFAFKSGDFTETGVPVLKIKNVRLREVDTTQPAYVDESVAKDAARYFCKTGDLLISMTGSGPQAPNSVVGRVARFTGPSDMYLINQRVGRFVSNALDKLEMRYLFYVLAQHSTLWKLVSVASGSANQANISGSQIESLEIPLPPLAEQKAIASILGALDDKIELNRRMNATLEGMARALFQSWFVDFDPVRAKLDGRKPEGMDKATAALFPDAFEHTSDGEMVPKGWKMKCTADLFEVRDGTHDSPKRREHGFPLITSKHITNGGVDIENAYLISEEDFIQVNKRSKVDKFDTLMTMIGTVGVPLLVHEREPNFAIKNIGLFKTSKAREFSYYFYLYLISPEMQQFLKSRLAGTTQAFLSLGILRSLPILVPDSSLLLAFNKVCEQLFGIIATNRHQTDTLATLRDTLLPKLLSGELSVGHSTITKGDKL